MNKRRGGYWLIVGLALVLLGTRLLAGCTSAAKVGPLRTESQSVELADAKSVRVEIDMGAGDLQVTGGAEKLLEADFTYNVDKLKPVVEYKDGTLIVREPATNGGPDLRGVGGYRNEWGLHLTDEVPIDLRVDLGVGSSDLLLTGLSLTGLDVNLGAGMYRIDLSGDWARDLDIAIDAGAAAVTLQLPKDVGARVKVADGPHTLVPLGLTQEGNIYTNAAYGVSDVTLEVDLAVGIGQIILKADQAAATADHS